MGLGRAHLGDWTIRSRGPPYLSCTSYSFPSLPHWSHPTSGRGIGRETWRAESCCGYCYGDCCAPDTARNSGTLIYALGLLDRTHCRTRVYLEVRASEAATSSTVRFGSLAKVETRFAMRPVFP